AMSECAAPCSRANRRAARSEPDSPSAIAASLQRFICPLEGERLHGALGELAVARGPDLEPENPALGHRVRSGVQGQVLVPRRVVVVLQRGCVVNLPLAVDLVGLHEADLHGAARLQTIHPQAGLRVIVRGALEDAGVTLVHVAGRHRVPGDRVPLAALERLRLLDVTGVVLHIVLSRASGARTLAVVRSAKAVDDRAATALAHDLAARTAAGRVRVAL